MIKSILEIIIANRYRFSGCTIGAGPKISRSARLDLTNPKGIFIGSHVLISSNATVLSHDFVNQVHLCTKIGSNVFLGVNSVIMPGRIVGDNVIIGANSVVTADIPDNSVAVGVPAKVIRRTNKITKYGILSKDRDAN